jgi:N-acetylneuraminic acid mutarotase
MMKHLLFIIAFIVALCACKDSVKEDPTPAPKQTPESKPITVTFESVSVNLDKSVVIRGNVLNAEKDVKEYGFVYSKNIDFDLSSGIKVSFGSEPASSFTKQIQGLETKTNYTGKLYLVKNNDEVIYSTTKYFGTVASNTWIELASSPVYSDNGSGFVIGDTLYYIPGTVYSDHGVKKLFAFDLVKNTWVSKGELPFSLRVFPTTFSFNGKGYIMLGRVGTNNTNEVWEYDAATNKWTQKANCPVKMNSAAGFLLNDKFYVTMGLLSASQGSDIEGKMYEYDPLTDIWTTKPAIHPFPYSQAYGFGNSFVHNGSGYIYAGAYKWFPFSEYNPNTNNWSMYNSPIPGLEGPGGTYSAQNPRSVLIKNKLFTALGDSRNDLDMYQYDMVNKSWLKIGTYPAYIHSAFLTNFKDKVFFISGSKTYLFLPESD